MFYCFVIGRDVKINNYQAFFGRSLLMLTPIAALTRMAALGCSKQRFLKKLLIPSKPYISTVARRVVRMKPFIFLYICIVWPTLALTATYNRVATYANYAASNHTYTSLIQSILFICCEKWRPLSFAVSNQLLPIINAWHSFFYPSW